MLDKDRRIIVVQIKEDEITRSAYMKMVENMQKCIDDSVRVLFLRTKEIIGDRQIYDITGANDELVERILDVYENLKKCHPNDMK